jgi:uncharacterized cupredoxin-like copper-binding protein
MKLEKLNILLRSSVVVAVTTMAASAVIAGGTHGGGHGESSIGEPGIAAKVSRTILVDAADSMRFTPSNISVKKGETIRFVIKNTGKVPHEFSLGTEKELLEHYEVMKKFPNMEHDEANKVSIKPGKQGEVIWRFTKPGVVNFACLHVGHYDAGMKGVVKVAAK